MAIEQIEQVLIDRAVDDDADVKNAWDIKHNSHITRVVAATKDVFSTASTACEAAVELAGALTNLGYEMAYSEIGAVQLEDSKEWRGRVNLGLRKLAP